MVTREKIKNLILKSEILCDDCGPQGPTCCAEALAALLAEAGAVLLPCKIGQTGYWVTSCGILPVTFDRIYLNGGNEWRFRARYHCTETVYFRFSDFDRIVFLEYEKAKHPHK